MGTAEKQGRGTVSDSTTVSPLDCMQEVFRADQHLGMSGQGQSFAAGRDAHWCWVCCFIVLGSGAFPSPSITELMRLHHTVTKEQKGLGPPLQTPCSGSSITQPWAASTPSSKVYSYPDLWPSCFVLCLEHSFFSKSNSLSFLRSQLEGLWLWQAPCHPNR